MNILSRKGQSQLLLQFNDDCTTLLSSCLLTRRVRWLLRGVCFAKKKNRLNSLVDQEIPSYLAANSSCKLNKAIQLRCDQPWRDRKLHEPIHSIRQKAFEIINALPTTNCDEFANMKFIKNIRVSRRIPIFRERAEVLDFAHSIHSSSGLNWVICQKILFAKHENKNLSQESMHRRELMQESTQKSIQRIFVLNVAQLRFSLLSKVLFVFACDFGPQTIARDSHAVQLNSNESIRAAIIQSVSSLYRDIA